jgi:hypothetical protein
MHIVSILAALNGISVAHSAPVTYKLDPTASQLTVAVFKDNSALSDLAHDHVIAAKGWTGSATLDVAESGTVEGCSITVHVPVASLEPDIPALRRARGWSVMLTDPQRAQVKEHMVDKDQLDADTHPSIAFNAEHCTGTLGALNVEGSLSIRGQSKAIRLTLNSTVENGVLTGTGEFNIRHSDFGFKPYAAFLGTLRNQEQMTITVQITGNAR